MNNAFISFGVFFGGLALVFAIANASQRGHELGGLGVIAAFGCLAIGFLVAGGLVAAARIRDGRAGDRAGSTESSSV